MNVDQIIGTAFLAAGLAGFAWFVVVGTLFAIASRQDRRRRRDVAARFSTVVRELDAREGRR